MFTVCPKCALTLVVTAGDLRVAQGYVRCGRCSNVFNAISALSDERQAQAETPAPPETEPPATALEFDPAATNVADVFIEPQIGDDEATGTFESIVLEGGPADDGDPEPDVDEDLKQELQSLAAKIEAERHATEPRRVVDAGLPDLASLGMAAADEAPEEEQGPAWTWRAGIAALSLLMVVQVVHHYRNSLAVNPQLGGVLTRAYDALGVSLEPRWDIGAYEVRQLGAASDPRNEEYLVVRASIKNNAQRAQPLPLLRVAVQDRFGNAIATRDVAPASYLTAAAARDATLGSGQRLDVEMRFVDPGIAAVGFEIDACLAAPGGGVNCANR